MNTKRLQKYAPKARRDFIEAVTARAARFGIVDGEAPEVTVEGDIAIIGGEAYPKKVATQRREILERIKANGFAPTMEAMAYTWFNRLMALRYMELHGFLDHGYRVLSHPDGDGLPEIVQHAQHVDLPGLDQETVTELKLAGNRDEELYRMLLLAQCHALHSAMPFLFESIDDATELLLPENLLHSDSLIRRLVNEIPEEDWETVEVVGWLYQFYISEKKDEVIGKVVASEDIPAATQLFTPNWIVKYMVQNSIGAQWLATYPDSGLREQMEYYIEPAEQTEEVQAQLDAITPKSLDPEELTLIDPACGSGHILVEAYDLFKAIYLERGYQQRDVAKLILEKNLYGLDIDRRAAQLTGFALMMRARSDDRRLFERGVEPNVMALRNSGGVDVEEIVDAMDLDAFGLKRAHLEELRDLFEHATTFGSLIQVPESLAEKLPKIQELSKAASSDLFVGNALKGLDPLVLQALLLARLYDAVVANPPYMGSRKGMNGLVKQFTKNHFPDAKNDLFACFIDRGYTLSKGSGNNAFVTLQNWMFLSAFAKFRDSVLAIRSITSLVHIGYNSFPTLNSKIAQACAFTINNTRIAQYKGQYVNLNSAEPSADKNVVFVERTSELEFAVKQESFESIPGSPLAFWISEDERKAFSKFPPNGELCTTSNGVQTGDNDLFVREWFEVSVNRIGENWVPYNKGGPYKKWFGDTGNVVEWEHEGAQIKSQKNSCCRGEENFFKPCLTWTDVTWRVSGRYLPEGYISDAAGPCAHFHDSKDAIFALGIFNTPLADEWSQIINPTLHFQAGDFKKIPFPELYRSEEQFDLIQKAIAITKDDLETSELCNSFSRFPLLASRTTRATGELERDFCGYMDRCRAQVSLLKNVEIENLGNVIGAFLIEDRKLPEIKDEWITLLANPQYRYGGKQTVEEQWARFRQETMEELISYAIGCMMGRYSLDEPGLIYAHSGNEGFDASRYTTFPVDEDGILPITDTLWFEDDAAKRLEEFLSVAWPAEHLEDNLSFLADNLKPRKSEPSRDTIRRYLCDKFFKDHLKTYKKRPIYWLFSSGKHKALQCLVYLHRYNEGTLSRMRMDYAVPLMGRLNARIDALETEVAEASSTAQANALRKELTLRKNQLEELRKYDEKLRHYADQRISLDLDDGVKVNYGKFGDLLAEVKAVTGKNPK